MKHLLLQILFMVLVFKISAQPAGFPQLKNIPGAYDSLVSTNFYDGSSLWGYMDGGADLYLEYGFSGLCVQEIVTRGVHLKCEIFKMQDPLCAFGIFSVQKHQCRTSPILNGYQCLNNYQVQLVRGEYYISVVNSTADTLSQQVALHTAAALQRLIPEQTFNPPKIRRLQEQTGDLLFVRGKISLGNVYPGALGYFDELEGYQIWIVPGANQKIPDFSYYIFEKTKDLDHYLSLAFPGQKTDSVYEIKPKKGITRLAIKTGNQEIVVLEGKISKKMKKMFSEEPNK